MCQQIIFLILLLLFHERGILQVCVCVLECKLITGKEKSFSENGLGNRIERFKSVTHKLLFFC